jgi:hypothetical protein
LAAHFGCPRELFATVREALPISALRERFAPESRLELVLDRDLVITLDCGCGHSRPIHRARAAVKLSEAACEKCGETMHPKMEHVVAEDSPLASETLSTLGVPAYDIVRVGDGGQEVYVALEGDRVSLMGAT